MKIWVGRYLGGWGGMGGGCNFMGMERDRLVLGGHGQFWRWCNDWAGAALIPYALV